MAHPGAIDRFPCRQTVTKYDQNDACISDVTHVIFLPEVLKILEIV